jgi:hypothetical protein
MKEPILTEAKQLAYIIVWKGKEKAKIYITEKGEDT